MITSAPQEKGPSDRNRREAFFEPLVRCSKKSAAADAQTGYRDPVLGLRRIEVKGRTRGFPIRLTTNEWYKAAQLGDSYWLYVVWDPLNNPNPEPVRIQNPVKHLDHAKREVVAARYFDIPATAVEQAATAPQR